MLSKAVRAKELISSQFDIQVVWLPDLREHQLHELIRSHKISSVWLNASYTRTQFRNVPFSFHEIERYPDSDLLSSLLDPLRMPCVMLDDVHRQRPAGQGRPEWAGELAPPLCLSKLLQILGRVYAVPVRPA